MRRYFRLRSRDAATGITRLAANDVAFIVEDGNVRGVVAGNDNSKKIRELPQSTLVLPAAAVPIVATAMLPTSVDLGEGSIDDLMAMPQAATKDVTSIWLGHGTAEGFYRGQTDPADQEITENWKPLVKVSDLDEVTFRVVMSMVKVDDDGNGVTYGLFVSSRDNDGSWRTPINLYPEG